MESGKGIVRKVKNGVPALFCVVVPRFDFEALLHQEMQDLKQRRETLKRQCKDAAKEQKLLDAKRRRLLKASSIQARSCHLFFGFDVHQTVCFFSESC